MFEGSAKDSCFGTHTIADMHFPGIADVCFYNLVI